MRKTRRLAAMAKRRAGRTRPALLVVICIAALSLVALMAPSIAPGTPPTPTITVSQIGSLQMRFTSSSGTKWSWTFVDAVSTAVVATSTVARPQLTFPHAGNYIVKLDAGDADPVKTAPAHAEATFHVYARPTASFTATVLAGGNVQLTDTSTGEPTAWVWSLPGGATFNGQKPPVQAMPAGTSKVTLKVTNPGGNHTVSQSVTINGPPNAVLTISSSTEVMGTPVIFSAASSTDPNGDALTYSWDLDGNQVYGDASGPTQTRSYAAPGTYRVGVQVSDGHGGTSTAVGFVTILPDQPPTVTFSVVPAQPVVGAQATFTATASDPDGTVDRIEWDLDNDGKFDDAAGPVGTWTFNARGPRVVSVRAIDDKGVATVAFRTIDVIAPQTSNVAGTTTGSSVTQPQPGSAPASSSPVRAPSSSGPTVLSPFPVVRIRGLIYRRSVRINLLSIEAPKGSTVNVVCRGASCSKRRLRRRVTSARRSVRFRPLEHRMRAGTVIEIRVTAPGQIGKYTSFTIRPNAAPLRRDLCLMPGRSAPAKCPSH